MPPPLESLAASCGTKAHVWQPFGGQPDLGHFSVASDGKLYAVQWNQNNKVIVSGGQSGVVALNYSRDGSLMGTLPKAPSQADRLSPISSIAFSRGSKLLAAGCIDSSVRVWDLKQQTCKYFLDSHKAAVTYVAFSPDDQQLASSSLTGEIHLHTVRQTSQAAVLRTPGNRAKRSLHFTPLEPLLATGAEDGSLYCWDTTTYTLLDSYLQMHSATVSRVCFSPGSPSILVSAGLDRAAVLTDRRLDAAVARVQASQPLTALDCHYGGQCITVGTTSGVVLLYDPRRLDAPTLELACADGEPVTCLHWQQALAPARASRQGSSLRSPAASPSASQATAGTPPPPQQQPQQQLLPPALRTQEFLSAASPATPMVQSARGGPGAARPLVPAPMQHLTARASSSGLERSLAASERPLSHAAAQPQPLASAREAAPAAAADAGPARTSAHESAAPDAALLTHGRGAAAPASARLSAREQLAATPPAPATERHTSREEPAAAAPAVEEATLASARQNGAQPEPPQSSRRFAADAEPSPAGASLPEPGDGGEAGQHAGPTATAAAASFGVRLKSLLAAQAPDEPLPELNGHAAGRALESRSSRGSISPAAADEIRAAISSDIKTLHFEMIRQFHIQQVEMRQLVDAVVKRQDSLAQELAALRGQVQALAARQPGPQALWD